MPTASSKLWKPKMIRSRELWRNYRLSYFVCDLLLAEEFSVVSYEKEPYLYQQIIDILLTVSPYTNTAHIHLFTAALTNNVSLPIRMAKRKWNTNTPCHFGSREMNTLIKCQECNLAMCIKTCMKYMHVFWATSSILSPWNKWRRYDLYRGFLKN